jgi:hypothetical protein
MISILQQHDQDKRFDQVPTILAGWGVYPVGLEWQQTNWLELSY